MKATQHVTGILLVAAFAAVACSKHEDKATKADPHASPPAEAAAVQPTVGKQFDDEGFVGTPPKAAVSIPITFAERWSC